MCVAWIINEDVLSLIQNNWIPYIADEGSQVVAHFAQNMAHVKTTLKSWANTKKYLDDQAIIQIEAGLAESQNDEGDGFLTQAKKEKFISLESNRTKILKEREEVLRLKGRAIWLASGDDNTHKIQALVVNTDS